MCVAPLSKMWYVAGVVQGGEAGWFWSERVGRVCRPEDTLLGRASYIAAINWKIQNS